MSRDFLSNTTPATSAEQSLKSAQSSLATTSDTQSATIMATAKDALAGSLPAWDLLPATPFIRRVK